MLGNKLYMLPPLGIILFMQTVYFTRLILGSR